MDIAAEFEMMLRDSSGEVKPKVALLIKTLKEYKFNISDLTSDEINQIFACLIIASREVSNNATV